MNLSDQSFTKEGAYPQIGEASGNVPYAFGVPNVTESGQRGTVRDITPTYGGQNNPAVASFNPWEASTGHLNLGGGISTDAPKPAPTAQPNSAGGVNSDYMIHPGNVPGYSTQAGQGGQPVLPGDKMGAQ
jgi:hypothetical protein